MFLTFNFRDWDWNQLKQTWWSLFLKIEKLPNGTLITDNQLLVLVNFAYWVIVLLISWIIVALIYKFLSNFNNKQGR